MFKVDGDRGLPGQRMQTSGEIRMTLLLPGFATLFAMADCWTKAGLSRPPFIGFGRMPVLSGNSNCLILSVPEDILHKYVNLYQIQVGRNIISFSLSFYRGLQLLFLQKNLSKNFTMSTVVLGDCISVAIINSERRA